MTQDQLKLYDFYLLIDKSGSMAEPVKSGSSTTRWHAAEEATVALATECTKYDSDGISVVLFANNHKNYENVDGGAELVKKIFTENGPNGGTDTAGALSYVLDSYFARKKANAAEAKPLIIFCITDGIPNEEGDLIKAITAAVNKMDSEDEIRINFIQIGNDTHAREFLVRLDTGLNLKYDIVNCKSEEEVENHGTLADAVLSMVNDLAEATA